MRKLLRDILLKFAYFCSSGAHKIFQYPQEKRVKSWFEIQGDRTLRLEYNLDENSTVFDLGGYEGQWASDIFAKYCCRIYIFEPVLDFANEIESRFGKNNRITVFKFGLADETKKAKITINKNSSSFYLEGKDIKEVELVNVMDFIQKKNIHKIDLMKINIEGGEYELLDHIINSGFIENIKNIQVQFHDFIPNAEQLMKKTQIKLEKTHFLTYEYPFVWENWKLKN